MNRAPLLSGPNDLRNRWALCAALTAAQGWPDHCFARGDTWHYDDGGGNWADVRLVGDDRAVLVGHDHEYSETYYAGAAEYFGETETDLLAGVPAWWRESVQDYIADIEARGMWIGFVYGYESGVWSRADYSRPDGFESLNLPAARPESIVDHLVQFLRGIGRDQGVGDAVDLPAVEAAVSAGPAVTVDQLRAMFGPRSVDLDAGVAAARAFA